MKIFINVFMFLALVCSFTIVNTCFGSGLSYPSIYDELGSGYKDFFNVDKMIEYNEVYKDMDISQAHSTSVNSGFKVYFPQGAKSVTLKIISSLKQCDEGPYNVEFWMDFQNDPSILEEVLTSDDPSASGEIWNNKRVITSFSVETINLKIPAVTDGDIDYAERGHWIYFSITGSCNTNMTVRCSYEFDLDAYKIGYDKMQWESNGDPQYDSESSTDITATINAEPVPTSPLEVKFSLTDVLPAPLEGSSYTYSWDFGDKTSDANTSTEDSPTHTFSDAGTYTATVTITDPGNGASSTLSKEISVESGSSGGDDYGSGYNAGKQFCIDHPDQCGINTCTDYELQAKYEEGYNQGKIDQTTACSENPESCGIITTPTIGKTYENGYSDGYDDGYAAGTTYSFSGTCPESPVLVTDSNSLDIQIPRIPYVFNDPDTTESTTMFFKLDLLYSGQNDQGEFTWKLKPDSLVEVK